MPGPRAAARGEERIRPGARRDKSPGDLGGQDWLRSGLANPRSDRERRGLHHETRHISPDCPDAGSPPGLVCLGRGEERLQHRLDHLCGLDALALCSRSRHREEVGRQVRPHHHHHADQRLRGVDQPVHGRQVRRRDRHQHGRPDDPCGRRRRHHAGDRRRLLQRQRWHRAQEGQDHRRHQGPEDQHGRAVCLALPARPGAVERQAEGSADQGRQHLRCRHRRCVQVGGLYRSGNVEPAADGGQGRAGRHARL